MKLLLTIGTILIFALSGCYRGTSENTSSTTPNAKIESAEKDYAFPPVTLRQYDQLHVGMTRQEVTSILGSIGHKEEFKDEPDPHYYWRNSDRSYINVNFKDDKVSSVVESGFKGEKELLEQKLKEARDRKQ